MASHDKDGASGNNKTPRQRITGSALARLCWQFWHRQFQADFMAAI